MEPVTGIIVGALIEWATGKVADALLSGVNNKLNRSDIDKVLKLATKAAQEQHWELFFSCQPDCQGKFLEQFFKGSGLEELQKPLKHQGMPNTEVLTATFIKAATEQEKRLGKIK